jgi:hypothetical protein
MKRAVSCSNKLTSARVRAALNNAVSSQRGLRLFLLLLCLGWALAPARLTALVPIESPQQYPIPADLSAVHFYLITVDVGDMVWDNFGHTALRVYDENTGTDTVFNWGLFDVSGGMVSFSYNFFKGIMNYRLGTPSPNQEFAMYRGQQRTVWQDKINLSNPQKEILYRRLVWNMQPENIVYAYQYYFDNCTTRVRDYIDEALTGRVAAQYDGVTDHTFRDQVRSHYESVPLVSFSLDILMNSNIDRAVSEWEDMYLPLSLRQSLAGIESDVAVGGSRLMLLSDSQLIMEFAPPTMARDGYQVASLTLLLPLLFLLLMLKKIPMSHYATHSRIGLKVAAINFRLLGLLGLLMAIFSGVYGMLMLGSWFVSDHLDLHHNTNLLLFWPTDLLGVVVALRWLLFCKPWPMSHNSTPFINYYLLAHVVGMLAYAVIWFFGLSAQSLDNVAVYVLPGFLVFTLLTWLVGFEPAKQKQAFY